MALPIPATSLLSTLQLVVCPLGNWNVVAPYRHCAISHLRAFVYAGLSILRTLPLHSSLPSYSSSMGNLHIPSSLRSLPSSQDYTIFCLFSQHQLLYLFLSSVRHILFIVKSSGLNSQRSIFRFISLPCSLLPRA